MSSNFMSKKIDVSKFGVIYGGAQKNLGTSGVALVIVREDLLNPALPICPSILDWTINAKADSIPNTPMFVIAKKDRSKMNIPFRIGSLNGDDVLEKEFLKGAEALGLIQLKGHRYLKF
ncbi:probable phosphoserine aminotransferase [Danaus plexippus]|uniref:probable phosphoserine aminotransferase n=1 Tax=Danaus plexippus TaxID=13037 RepID=UPI002AAFA9F0|nr:probable phosphoserine aminotransferase [Danaus plexippus]